MSEVGGEQNPREFDKDTLERAGRIMRLSQLGASASTVLHIDGNPVHIKGTGDGSVEMIRDVDDHTIRVTKASSDPKFLDKIG